MIQQLRKADSDVSLQKLCSLFELAVSTYYYKPVINAEDTKIKAKMKTLHVENFQTYGKRRMSIALKNAGFSVGRFKTRRLMQEEGIIAIRPKKPYYYQKGNELPTTPNLLARQFKQDTVNTHWVGDITYIRSHQGWSYLATVLDLGSREIVGYALSRTPDAKLAKQALIHAIKHHVPDTKQLLFHSDQGVQYTANLLLLGHTVQERFFRNLKTEYLNVVNQT